MTRHGKPSGPTRGRQRFGEKDHPLFQWVGVRSDVKPVSTIDQVRRRFLLIALCAVA
jgi:hypothetical protein